MVRTVLSCLVLLIAWAPGAAAADAAADGAHVYAAQKCGMCHSIAGKGNAKGALDDVGRRLSADDIRQWLTAPKEMAAKHKAERKPPMKSFASLPKGDLDALVAYLLTLKGPAAGR
jgi:mono/diheme cytochrome c family protein